MCNFVSDENFNPRYDYHLIGESKIAKIERKIRQITEGLENISDECHHFPISSGNHKSVGKRRSLRVFR